MRFFSVKKPSNQPPALTTAYVLHGSLVAVCILFGLITIYDLLLHSTWSGHYVWVALVTLVYLITAEVLLRKNKPNIVGWMLVIFYEALSLATLLTWGLNSPVGILTISFAVVLPSVLMGAASIAPVTILTVVVLLMVQTIHNVNIITPDTSFLSDPSTYWDVAIYSTVLSILALISWLSVRQRQKSLERALKAETLLQAQKDALSIELERESTRLRLAQLEQIKELHQFALLGQSAAATLHELSNHLSILTLDIDDLRQQHRHSEAIANAEESIGHINKMVEQTRQQLNSHNQQEVFNAASIINRCLKDIAHKFHAQKVTLKRPSLPRQSLPIRGNTMALMQILTIILNNALDACASIESPSVAITVETTPKHLVISVADNGPGISPSLKKSLFRPLASTKPTGMGVGLYIAHHLVETQFSGTLNASSSRPGACFTITIPLHK